MLWTVSLTTGPRRVNHAAVGVPEKRLLFSFGGYCTGEEWNQIEKMDVHIFNVSTLQWNKLKTPSILDSNYNSIPYMRYGHTASIIGHIVYIFGGRNDNYGACNTLYCFDTDTLKWTRPAVFGCPPEARDGHSACVIQTKIYIFGGFKEIDEQFSSDLFYLETATMTWHQPRTQSVNIWRDFHTSTSVGNSIYIFGGRGDRRGPIHTNEEIYDNTIYEFDTEKSKWLSISVKGKSPIGRRSHSAISYKDDIYIFGGYNGQLKKHFSDMWKFDLAKKCWTEVKTQGIPPSARRRHSWSVLGNEAVLFGGTCPSPNPLPFENQADEALHNLQDLSDVCVFDFSPTLTTLCKRAVLAYNMDCSELPYQIRAELESIKKESSRNRLSGMTQG